MKQWLVRLQEGVSHHHDGTRDRAACRCRAVRLLRETRDVLRPGGWLAVEVDCSRAGAVAARAKSLGWMDVAIHADLFGRERYLLARRSAQS